MTRKHIHLPTKNLLILSDLHLDKAKTWHKANFFNKLQKSDFDAVLITGDLSVAATLTDHLIEIGDACGDRPIIFTTGNHDYYGSSFRDVDQAIATLCSSQPNLISLGRGEVIKLSRSTALLGHRGWYDGLAGSGMKTRVESPDRFMIEDFRGMGRADFFRKLNQLGIESAEYFRRLLPRTLSRYQRVLVATHVPPYTQGLCFDGKGCVWNSQPFFSNRTLGNLIWGISKRFPDRQIQIHAGHTHSAASVRIRENLFLEVAGARSRKPTIGNLLHIS